MQPGFMSPASLAELKRSIDADRARKRGQITAGDRVRIAANEGAVECVLSGACDGKVVVQIDRGPFAGTAYVVDGDKCEVIST